jgi:hypothetical protein
MRCKRHPNQAGGGVCATCLRDRLLALEAAQSGDASPPGPAQAQAPEPPPAFPRSVSPYVSRRKSDTSGGALRHHPSLLFFRTPQVGPAYGGGGGGGALEEPHIGYGYGYGHEKRRAGKFSVLATLFGRHHHHRRPEARHQERKKHSWLAGIMPRRRRSKGQVPASATSPQSAPPRRSCRAVSNRGLSPERDGDGDDDESSSPAAWRPSPSPMRRTTCRRRQTSGSMPSGFAVCLSPLVRPIPGRRPVQPPDPGSFSSELRPPPPPPPLHSSLSSASVTRCRSRKLADGGRFR